MSAISGFINTIRNAVYGEQVRGAIVSALEQCYSDVNNPSLQSEGFTEALNAAYAGGILDIQTVTSFSDMTNDKIIYRYNGTAAGKQKGLYYFSALSDSWVLIGSEIQKVSLLSQMTDVNDIYKYIGTETGMVQNSLYCYNGSTWVPIGSGVLTAATAALMTNTGAIYKYTGSEAGYITNALYYYNGTAWVTIASNVITDKTLSEENVPADAAAVGAKFAKNGGFSNEAKEALLELLKNVAFTDGNGQDYYEALENAIGIPSSLVNGTYESAAKTASVTVNNNVITINQNAGAYQLVLIPLKYPISAKAGDVVTFNATSETVAPSITQTLLIGIAENVGASINPFNTGTAEGSVSLSADVVARFLRLSIHNAQDLSGKSFALSISVNDEVNF